MVINCKILKHIHSKIFFNYDLVLIDFFYERMWKYLHITDVILRFNGFYKKITTRDAIKFILKKKEFSENQKRMMSHLLFPFEFRN